MSDATRPVALITGGTRGIGRAIVDVLAPTHHVLVGGRSEPSVADVVAALPSAAPFVCELTDPQAVAAACAPLDRLDVLVHSAGVVSQARLDEADRDEWLRVLDINVVAVAELTRLLPPGSARRDRAGHRHQLRIRLQRRTRLGGVCRLEVRAARLHRCAP